jgi:predicted RNase H-like nuclease
MPIGLPDAGRRMADTLARQAVGPRRASVFVTPVRAALEEASFAQLAGAQLTGGPLPVRKSTWAGAALRRQLLADAGIVLAGNLGIAGERAGVDDVLDAAAAGWTALRVARGQARSLPDPPEIFSDQLACAIWI